MPRQTSSLDLPKTDCVVLCVVVRVVQSSLHDLARIFQEFGKFGCVQKVGLFRIGQFWQRGQGCQTGWT